MRRTLSRGGPAPASAGSGLGVRPWDVPPTRSQPTPRSPVLALASREIGSLTSFELRGLFPICRAAFRCQRTVIGRGWRELCRDTPVCRSISSKFETQTVGQYRVVQNVSERVPWAQSDLMVAHAVARSPLADSDNAAQSVTHLRRISPFSGLWPLPDSWVLSSSRSSDRLGLAPSLIRSCVCGPLPVTVVEQ